MSKLILISCIAIAAILGTVHSEEVTCPYGWTDHDGACYIVYLEKLSWHDAQRRCEQAYSNLASIHSVADEEFIRVLGKISPEEFLWIGLNDIETEGQFNWSDDSKHEITYWGADEPNNAWGNEDCTALLDDNNWRMWNDFSCGDRNQFICQWVRPSASSSVCPIGWHSFNNACYHASYNPLSWKEANEFCQGDYSQLTSVHSSADHDFLSSLTENHPDNQYWIGLTDSQTEGTYQWSDGSIYDIFFWDTNEPNDAWFNEDCTAMGPANKWRMWNDDNCNNQHNFICEWIHVHVATREETERDEPSYIMMPAPSAHEEA